eukprot:2206288-Rhodomonas_salina.2
MGDGGHVFVHETLPEKVEHHTHDARSGGGVTRRCVLEKPENDGQYNRDTGDHPLQNVQVGKLRVPCARQHACVDRTRPALQDLRD